MLAPASELGEGNTGGRAQPHLPGRQAGKEQRKMTAAGTRGTRSSTAGMQGHQVHHHWDTRAPGPLPSISLSP